MDDNSTSEDQVPGDPVGSAQRKYLAVFPLDRATQPIAPSDSISNVGSYLALVPVIVTSVQLVPLLSEYEA